MNNPITPLSAAEIAELAACRLSGLTCPFAIASRHPGFNSSYNNIRCSPTEWVCSTKENGDIVDKQVPLGLRLLVGRIFPPDVARLERVIDLGIHTKLPLIRQAIRACGVRNIPVFQAFERRGYGRHKCFVPDYYGVLVSVADYRAVIHWLHRKGHTKLDLWQNLNQLRDAVYSNDEH